MTLGSICRCGRIITDGSKTCPDHKAKDTRPNAYQRGYDAEHRKDRKRLLLEQPFCQHPGCSEPSTVLDHIDGLGPLGPRGHDRDNHRAYCETHHNQRTARDQPPGSATRGSYWQHPFLVIVGPSGVGKTAVRNEMVKITGADSLGPDDFVDRWDALFDRLDASKNAVVECVLIHSGLRRRIKERRARVVKLTAPTWVLRDRMDRRGEDDRTIQRRINQTFEAGYGHEIVPDLELEVSDMTPLEAAERIVAEMGTP